MAEYIKRVDVMKICESYSEHCFNSNDASGQDIADRILDDVIETPTADVVEVKDCEQCIHYGKHVTEYPCSHCRNCYTDKFQPNDTRTPKERGGEK